MWISYIECFEKNLTTYQLAKKRYFKHSWTYFLSKWNSWMNGIVTKRSDKVLVQNRPLQVVNKVNDNKRCHFRRVFPIFPQIIRLCQCQNLLPTFWFHKWSNIQNIREFKIRRLRTTTTVKHATAHDQNHVTVRFSHVVLRLRWVVELFRVVGTTENILLVFCRLGSSRISSFRKKVFNSPALSEGEANYVSCA